MIKNIKKFLNFQPPKNPNRSIVNFLSDLGYSKHSIRKTLMVLNGFKYTDFNDSVHPVTLSRVVVSGNGGKKARKSFADKFNLDPDELFGDN